METYKTTGTCAKEIKFEVEAGVIKEVKFLGGCTGNLAGIASLVEGQEIEEVVNRLEGITCRNGTSCPDQLSKALKNLT